MANNFLRTVAILGHHVPIRYTIPCDNIKRYSLQNGCNSAKSIQEVNYESLNEYLYQLYGQRVHISHHTRRWTVWMPLKDHIQH